MLERIRGRRFRDTFLLSGWLFADLLLGLMVIFMVSATAATPPQTPCAVASPTASTPTATPCVPTPTNTFTPTPTNTVPGVACGLDLKSLYQPAAIDVADPDGLRNNTPEGQSSFNDQVEQLLASYNQRIAGLIEIFGGGADVSIGENFAGHGQKALQDQQNSHIDATTFIQAFGDEKLGTNQMRLLFLFYLPLPNGQSCG